MEWTDDFINSQTIHDKNVLFIKSKLKECLETPQDDPTYDLSCLSNESKEAKLIEVAQIMQHFGPSEKGGIPPPPCLSDNSNHPELRRQLKSDDDVCWKKVKRYRLCFYGNRQLLQKGDYVILDDDQKGVVQYFTQENKNQVVQVHITVLFTRSNFSAVWQKFLKSAEEFVITDKTTTVPLGRVIQVLPEEEVVLSCFVFKNDCLTEREQSSVDFTLTAKLLVHAYLTTDTKMLRYHPLVRAAANSVHLLCKWDYLVDLILSNFLPYSANMMNDMEDEKKFEFGDFAELRRIGVTEDLCTVCGIFGKLVFNQEGSQFDQESCHNVTACASCYIRLRKIYRGIFSILEPWRIESQSQKNVQTNENLEEVYLEVARLLQSSTGDCDGFK